MSARGRLVANANSGIRGGMPSARIADRAVLWLDRIRTEQTRILVRNCPPGVLGAASGGAVLAFAFARAGRCNPAQAASWVILLFLCAALHIGLCVAHRRLQPANERWRVWLWSFTAIAALEGVVWFLGAFWMTSPTDLTQELIVLLVSSAIASGAVPVFGTYLPTYLFFFFPAIAPHVWFAFDYDYPFHVALAALLFAYLVSMTAITNSTYRQLVESLLLRFENADLLLALQHQTEAAVRANEEKSRFLAVASHDLRQPIHALGLYLGALRSRPQDADSVQLLDDMNVSLGAMDDLFSALLDISKLDAGIVEASSIAVPLAPLFERLGREYRAFASGKGLLFDAVRVQEVVRSDPVLLERVLRNLLSNAVRYTEHGRIGLECRRDGDHVLVELSDTGIGIAPADLEKVFDEFHQVGNPERDRSKGLGLGLAIVRRVVPLIGAEISLSSKIGSGSVFSLHLPLWDGVIEAGHRVPTDVAPAVEGVIVVVDDERDIRQAMAALLKSWGMPNIVAASADDAIAAIHSEGAAPALFICDYRLRDGLTGIEAIQALRAEFGQNIPALVITGDTGSERLGEIRESDFPVLHKPVRHARLRAAIGNLTRASGH